jgi:hypothetical protein
LNFNLFHLFYSKRDGKRILTLNLCNVCSKMCGVKWSDAFVSVNVRRGFMNCQIFCETGSIKRKIESGIPAPEALKVKYVQ